MNYILIAVGALVIAVILFALANHIVKRRRAPRSAEGGIWNAVYFIHFKQYQTALDILNKTEAEYAMTPEVMCDFCVQKADAHKGLGQYQEAADAYDLLYEAMQESGRAVKRNDALLAELRDCYAACGREADFEKWAQLFSAPDPAPLPESKE